MYWTLRYQKLVEHVSDNNKKRCHTDTCFLGGIRSGLHTRSSHSQKTISALKSTSTWLFAWTFPMNGGLLSFRFSTTSWCHLAARKRTAFCRQAIIKQGAILHDSGDPYVLFYPNMSWPVSWHFILPVRFSYLGLLRMRILLRINIASIFSRWTTICNVSELL